jgi:drug/metabolite transporter (DMT)-like permease
MHTSRQTTISTILSTILAMIAFAANSVLCRLALGENSIDAAGFTSIRLISGALVLYIILIAGSKNNKTNSKGSWLSALMLFIYAAAFSFAYISLDTGTGALILFGAVQLSMVIISLFSDHRMHLSEWLGMIISFSGFVFLVLPGVSAPSLSGFILMSLAGIAWGIYTLRGRETSDPKSDTTYNFLRTLPFIIVFVIITSDNLSLSSRGVWLAVLSGGITSGIGYVIWYMALRGLSTTIAAVVQLSVPLIAAIGGVMFVSEEISVRLILSTILILGGIFIVIFSRNHFARSR